MPKCLGAGFDGCDGQPDADVNCPGSDLLLLRLSLRGRASKTASAGCVRRRRKGKHWEKTFSAGSERKSPLIYWPESSFYWRWPDTGTILLVHYQYYSLLYYVGPSVRGAINVTRAELLRRRKQAVAGNLIATFGTINRIEFFTRALGVR